MKVEVTNLVKTFDRGFRAVDGLSFSFSSGEVIGFVGPNGAGKTTTMRIMSTLDTPDSGDITLDGISVLDHPEQAHRLIGFMPDDLPAAIRKAVEGVEEFTGLTEFRDRTLHALSKGMKQRVSLARALVHDPAVLIMDEPANGLDPRARIELRELVKALGENGKAILISSHILSELEEMCTSSVIIERGRRLNAEAAVSAETWIKLRFLPDVNEKALPILLETPGVIAAESSGNGWRVKTASGDEAAAALAGNLFARELVPVLFEPEVGKLEDIFMHVTKGNLA